jgi:hypothetical protein
VGLGILLASRGVCIFEEALVSLAEVVCQSFLALSSLYLLRCIDSRVAPPCLEHVLVVAQLVVEQTQDLPAHHVDLLTRHHEVTEKNNKRIATE